SPDPDSIRSGGANASVWLHGDDERLPFRGDVALLHALRLLGLLFGAAAVLLGCAIGVEVFPDSPSLARGVGWMLALLPQLAHVSACFGNDGAAAAAGALAILALLRAARLGTARASLLAGATVGLASITKLTGLALVPVGGLCVLLAPRAPLGARLRRGL